MSPKIIYVVRLGLPMGQWIDLYCGPPVDVGLLGGCEGGGGVVVVQWLPCGPVNHHQLASSNPLADS